MSTQSKEWVCGCSLARTACSDPAGGHWCLSLECVMCCQVEVFASG